jgi:hypothetical protein
MQLVARSIKGTDVYCSKTMIWLNGHEGKLCNLFYWLKGIPTELSAA